MKLNTKPLAGIEIGIPVIAEGNYHLKIEKAEVKPNKTQDGQNLMIQFKVLNNPVVTHKDGKEIENKGQIPLTRYFSLKPTPDYDPDKAMKELAVAIGLPEDKDLELADLLGKIVIGKVVYKEAEGQYREGNDIRRLTPVPADDTFTLPPFA